MREHPAARQFEMTDRVVGTTEKISLFDHPDSDKLSFSKDKNLESDGKLGELPEFLVYVYKAKKYDLL